MPQYLFICGCQRSGTTVLAQLLSSHPGIALGMERFKHLALPDDFRVEAALFEEERFFDFRETDTNITPKSDARMEAHYAAVREHFAAAKVLGDKDPDYHFVLDELDAAFPECRILFVLRDPVEVASSWQVRALRPESRWPREYDYRASVDRWNLALENALVFHRAHPGPRPQRRLAVCDYGKLVSGTPGYLAAMLKWIGVDEAPEILAYYQDIVLPKAERLRDKPSALSADEADWVRRHADEELRAAVLAGTPF